MKSTEIDLFLSYLGTSLRSREWTKRSDQELLLAYTLQQEQAAFAELMHRYGPLVLNVCRRSLQGAPEAEDAFQATFIALSCQARRLKPGMLGGWLHRVAYRCSAKLRMALAKRKDAEKNVAVRWSQGGPDTNGELSWEDFRVILDEELDSLPQLERSLLVGNYLRGRTHAELAGETGLPLGSVARRIDRAKGRLKGRLSRRGISLGLGLLGGALTQAAAASPVGAGLLVRTFNMVASGKEVIPNHVAILASLADPGKRVLTVGKMLIACFVGASVVGAIATKVGMVDGPTEVHPPASASSSSPRAEDTGDLLPERAIARLGTRRFRHPNSVVDASCLPGNQEVVTLDREGVARVWRLSDGQLMRQINTQMQHRPKKSVVFVGSQLVCVTRDQRIAVWDVLTGKEAQERGEMPEEGELVAGPASSALVITVKDGQLVFANAMTRKVDRRWKWTGKSVPQGLVFSPDGKTVAIPEENCMTLRRGSNGEVEHEFKGSVVGGPAPVFSLDGKYIAFQLLNRPLQVIEVGSGQEFLRVAGTGVHKIAFSPSGKRLALAAKNGEVRVFELQSPRAEFPAESFKLQGVLAGQFPDVLAFTNDNQGLVTGGTDNRCYLWSAVDGKTRLPVEGPSGILWEGALSADGKRAATWGMDGILRSWDVTSNRLSWSVSLLDRELAFEGQSRPKVLAVSDDGLRIVTVHTDGKARVWGGEAGELIGEISIPYNAIHSRCLSGNGGLLVVLGQQKEAGLHIGVWDTSSRRKLSEWQPKLADTPLAIAVSQDGRYLAALVQNEDLELNVRIWDLIGGKEQHSYMMNGIRQPFLPSLMFHPNGQYLAVKVAGTLQLLEISSGQAVWQLSQKGPSDDVTAVAFTLDGSNLATTGNDGVIRIRDVDSVTVRQSFRGHEAGVESLSAGQLPDGRQIILSALDDSTALVWKIPDELAAPRRLPAIEDYEQAWVDLAGPADKAHAVMSRLIAEPTGTIKLLKQKLQPTKKTPAQGPEIMDRPSALSSDQLRVLRSILVLERSQARAAHEWLQELSQGDPTAHVTKQATLALQRLKRTPR